KEEVEKLHDFEEECVQDYCREIKDNENKRPKVKLESISSIMAAMQYRLSEIYLGQQKLRGQIRVMGDEVLTSQEEVLSQIYGYKNQISMLVPEIGSDQINTVLENGDPALLESVLWLLKNNSQPIMSESDG
ncbi:unnamed protein product, partial [Hymenolepis diminuta]